jgi:hypothetical protein
VLSTHADDRSAGAVIVLAGDAVPAAVADEFGPASVDPGVEVGMDVDVLGAADAVADPDDPLDGPPAGLAPPPQPAASSVAVIASGTTAPTVRTP